MLYNPQWKEVIPETKPMEPWQEHLLRAADRIQKRGWCQHQATDFWGRSCIIGALDKTKTSDREYGLSICAISAFLYKETGDYVCIPDWNDDDRRTKKEVVNMLRQAAKMGVYSAV